MTVMQISITYPPTHNYIAPSPYSPNPNPSPSLVYNEMSLTSLRRAQSLILKSTEKGMTTSV